LFFVDFLTFFLVFAIRHLLVTKDVYHSDWPRRKPFGEGPGPQSRDRRSTRSQWAYRAESSSEQSASDGHKNLNSHPSNAGPREHNQLGQRPRENPRSAPHFEVSSTVQTRDSAAASFVVQKSGPNSPGNAFVRSWLSVFCLRSRNPASKPSLLPAKHLRRERRANRKHHHQRRNVAQVRRPRVAPPYPFEQRHRIG